MLLRYLHLQSYPPIQDIQIRFSSKSFLMQQSDRHCAIRFVVGLNGSGKSNLLRAIAEVFLALVDLRIPPFPVSLVYELGERGSKSHRTLLLHCPGGRQEASLWVAYEQSFSDDADDDALADCLGSLDQSGAPTGLSFSELIVRGSWPLRDSTPPQIALPSAVLAYTTGDLRPWRSVWNRNQDARDVVESGDGETDVNDERPAGWTAADEAALRLASRNSFTPEDLRSPRSSSRPDTYRRPILLDATLLKCALLAVTLQLSLQEAQGNERTEALKKLLEQGNWGRLVSVAFKVRLQTEAWDRRFIETAHDWLSCAGEVVAAPHPTEKFRTMYFDLGGALRAEKLLTLSSRGDFGSLTTQGESLLALLGGSAAQPFELFTRLLELNQAGLFSDVLLRLRRQPSHKGEENETALEGDIGVLRYEELSDGEQMVLGRMALFHLLQDQEDALLLLDEPETHFNDLWKREIVDIIDQAIGTTHNDVLISTHSAIVLSDVFNDEIILVEKGAEGSGVRPLSSLTFAADPSGLMMSVFGAHDSIGKRAQQFIDRTFSQSSGTAAEMESLQNLIDRMGSGFYRSELRTLLNQWRSQNA